MNLDKATELMYIGVKITHEDWIESEWITIDQGEYYDENGELFNISPWMLTDNNFKKWRKK